MTGADIIGALLRGYQPLVDVVPTDRIKGGRLPLGTQLPALLVNTISSNERQGLTRGKSVHTVDRVQVSVRAASWDEQITVLDLVVDACADRVGSMEGVESFTVLVAGRGPDLEGPGDSYEQAQDFRVSFAKPNTQGA